MSIEKTTSEFTLALNQDPAMQDRMRTTLDAADDRRQAAVEFAAAEGYQVTAESMDTAKASAERSAKLSDEDLEEVAGGLRPQPEPPGKTATSIQSTPTYNPQLTSTLLRW